MYKASELSIRLIEVEATFPSCTCINGEKKDHGRWQTVTLNLYLQKNDHFVSSLFLSEFAHNLYHKNILKQQPVKHRDKANNKQTKNSYLDQFTHESCSGDHIVSYRTKKILSSNDEKEKQSNAINSAWVSKEITM